MAPRASASGDDDNDPSLPAVPSIEDESEGDTGAYGENDLPDMSDVDPYDDVAASLGDDGMDVEDVAHVALDDEDGTADASVFAPDLGFSPVSLEDDFEEPGIGFDAIELDEGVRLDAAFDRGEEGPSEADDDLRAEDLPALDADEDGEMVESTLYETTLFVGVPRGEVHAWADRAWDVTRLADGSYASAAATPTTTFVHGPSGLAEIHWNDAGEPTLGKTRAPCPGAPTSLAAAAREREGDEALVVAGGAEMHRLDGDTWLPVRGGPGRVVGTATGSFALGRKGALLRFVGEGWVPADAARPSRRDLSAEEARLWVHALGASDTFELLALVLDEAAGDLVLERGDAPRLTMRGLSDDPAPTAVFARGHTLVVTTEDAGALVSWSSDGFVPLTGSRRALGITLCKSPGATSAAAVAAVLSAHADESRVTLLLHVEGESPRVIAVLEPRAEPDDDIASAPIALVSHGDKVLVGTAFGIFVVRPPRRERERRG